MRQTRYFNRRVRPIPGRAFTLLELMVVVGIIGLLLAIVIPSTLAILTKQKKNNTTANMEVLKTAIQTFESKKPLGDKYKNTARGFPYFGFLPPDHFIFHPATTSPPQESWDPTTQDLNKNGFWDPGEPITGDQPDKADEGHNRFNPVHVENDLLVGQLRGVQRKINGTWQPDDPLPGGMTVNEDGRSSETLYLYLSRLCPECQTVLTKLPVQILTNNDQCSTGSCPDKVILGIKPNTNPTQADEDNGQHVDLTEIRDAWGKPIRYQVERVGSLQSPSWKWELRSMGADETFTTDSNGVPTMFIPQEQSGDDVIVSGD